MIAAAAVVLADSAALAGAARAAGGRAGGGPRGRARAARRRVGGGGRRGGDRGARLRRGRRVRRVGRRPPGRVGPAGAHSVARDLPAALAAVPPDGAAAPRPGGRAAARRGPRRGRARRPRRRAATSSSARRSRAAGTSRASRRRARSSSQRVPGAELRAGGVGVALQRARELGAEIGLLRHERALRGPADVAAPPRRPAHAASRRARRSVARLDDPDRRLDAPGDAQVASPGRTAPSCRRPRALRGHAVVAAGRGHRLRELARRFVGPDEPPLPRSMSKKSNRSLLENSVSGPLKTIARLPGRRSRGQPHRHLARLALAADVAQDERRASPARRTAPCSAA